MPGFSPISLFSLHPTPIARAVPERHDRAPESPRRKGRLRGAREAGHGLRMQTSFEHRVQVPGTSVDA